MEFTAVDHALMIDYWQAGKKYNVHPKDIEAARHAYPHTPVTADPFDTELITVGKSWSLPEHATLIRKRVLSA